MEHRRGVRPGVVAPGRSLKRQPHPHAVGQRQSGPHPHCGPQQQRPDAVGDGVALLESPHAQTSR
jgi:hypothetical protein